MLMAEMTAAEARHALASLRPQIEKYAELIVCKGVNVKKGQEVVIQAPVESHEFVRLLVEKAYVSGAGHVSVLWSDEVVSRLNYEHVDLSYFEEVPEWQRVQLNDFAKQGACFIFVEGSDPEALRGIDPAKPAAASKARNSQCADFRHGLDFNINPWCIAGAPVASWARQVFPAVDIDVAMYKLWEAILACARATGENPQADWEVHNATFEKNLRFLNSQHFSKLHLQSKLGTDLYVGLTDRHIWEGGKCQTPDGHPFFPNIPTEEVFTTPDFRNVEGVVYSALPLVRHGSRIENFWLKFENGYVVDFDAERGKDALQQILDTDEGGRRLGEVALISKNTPIKESGVLFLNTLYDENASCHLALGMGFPECYDGGYDMDKDNLLNHGINVSATHVDFMIGTDDFTVTGIKEDGSRVPVFVNGQWAWE